MENFSPAEEVLEMAKFSIGGGTGGPGSPGCPEGPCGTCPKELTWAMEGVEEICWISIFLGMACRLHKLCLEKWEVDEKTLEIKY